jgi:hypothetical protein
MMFATYTEAGGGHIHIDALLELAKSGDIVARAEDSGCEGCYVEVARWKQGKDCHTGTWHRYCFHKLFGGEDLHPDTQDHATKEEMTSYATAGRIAARINRQAGTERLALIHGFPNWE